MSRNADFTPSRGNYTSLTPFRYWCQKVLPLVYDDSLSYYELLCKVVDYLNKTMEDTETLNSDVTNLYTAYQQLQQWVNDYYESEDFEQAIDAGLDRMVEDGSMDTIITPVIASQLPDVVSNQIGGVVGNQLPNVVSSQIEGVVGNQLPNVVSSQIGVVVGNQLPGVVSTQIDDVVEGQIDDVVEGQIGDVVGEQISPVVASWLGSNLTPTTPAIDQTLTILDAGADATITGGRLKTVENIDGYENINVGLNNNCKIVRNSSTVMAISISRYIDTYPTGSGNVTYKQLFFRVNAGERYCINAHKPTITGSEGNYDAFTYAYGLKMSDSNVFITADYEPNTEAVLTNRMITVPDITISESDAQLVDGYIYLCVVTTNPSDPVYKVNPDETVVKQQEFSALKDDLSEQTYNLITGKRENVTINSSGGFALNTGTDMMIAPVVANQTYTVKTNDVSGLVCGFFLSNPYSAGVKTYNNSRTIQSSKTITAPITGWIAFRTSSGYSEAQIVAGTTDKEYIKPITATDYIARKSIATAESDIADSNAKLNAIITTKPVYQDITDYTVTDGAYKQYGDGNDSASDAWEYATLPVSKGEQYKISSAAGQWAKPWIVLNSTNTVIDYSAKPTSSPVSVDTESVIIPQNGAYLIINNRKADTEINIVKKTGEQYVVDGDSVYIDGKDLQSALEGENISNTLYGKVLCCCGDSITYGDDMDTEGITNDSNITVYQSDASGDFAETTSEYRKTWNWQIASRNNMTLYNAGVNGSTMQGIAEKNGFSLANGRYTKLPDNIDYLLIWFGWNDTAYGTLGTINDSTNESYYGGYNVVLPYLINKYPYTKIGLIVPFGTDAGHRDAIRQLGNKWGVAVWDNYQGGTPLYYGKEDSVGVDASIVTANRAKFQANGAHPNYKGHKQLADMIEEFLRGI